jgi:hypothetical protein
MEVTGPTGTARYDSDHPEAAADPLSQMLGRFLSGMVGQSLKVRSKPDGTVVSVEGASKIADSIAKAAGTDPAAIVAVQMMRGTVNDDAMRNLLSQSFMRLPEQAVGPGDRWPSTMKISNAAAGSVTSAITSTLRSFEGPAQSGLAHIAVNLSMKQDAPVTAPNGGRVRIGDGHGDGEMVFDVGHGRVERSQMEVVVPSTISVNGPSGPVTVDARSTTTVRLERQAPKDGKR